MIVCKQCGYHNEEGDTFCGSCGSFLEWVGEKVGEEPEPEPEPVAEVAAEGDEKKHGLITRIKEKIAGEEEAEPGATENPHADQALSAADLAPEVPAAEVPAAEVPAAEVPAAEVPAAAPAAPEAPATPAAPEAPAAPAAGLAPPPVAEPSTPAEPTAPVEATAVAAAGVAATGLAAPPPPAAGLAAPPAGPANLPPPALTPEEAVKRAAEAKRQEDERKKAEAEAKRKADEEAKQAAEQARREAEEEAKRKEEEAKRRAALLVAKPKAVETPEQAKATTVAAAPAEAKKGKGKGKEVAAEAAVAAAATATVESRAPGAQQPGAQKPGAPAKAKAKAVKEPPSRVIKPGDLVCGDCGEGNDPGRKFCRRCGASLVDAPVAKKPGFFKRLFTRKPKAAPEAGTRPGGKGGGGGSKGSLGRSGRQAKGKFLGVFANARQFLAILAIFGIGVGLLLPNIRGKVFDAMNTGITKVKSVISPTYTTVFVDQKQTKATSETPGAPALNASNGIKNDHWAPLPTDQAPQLQMRFENPTNLDILFVYSGNQDDAKNFAANPRPKDIFITMVDSNLKKTSKQITLDDSPKAQKQTLSGKDIKTVIVDIQSCYPDPQNKSCSIAELEFQKKKT